MPFLAGRLAQIEQKEAWTVSERTGKLARSIVLHIEEKVGAPLVTFETTEEDLAGAAIDDRLLIPFDATGRLAGAMINTSQVSRIVTETCKDIATKLRGMAEAWKSHMEAERNRKAHRKPDDTSGQKA
jgi:hypothetical protein